MADCHACNTLPGFLFCVHASVASLSASVLPNALVASVSVCASACMQMLHPAVPLSLLFPESPIVGVLVGLRSSLLPYYLKWPPLKGLSLCGCSTLFVNNELVSTLHVVSLRSNRPVHHHQVLGPPTLTSVPSDAAALFPDSQVPLCCSQVLSPVSFTIVQRQ